MKTSFATTTLFATAIALVATATPLNHAIPSHGAGVPHWHAGHNGSHHHHHHNNNHTMNGTSTIRVTITQTRTSTIMAQPTLLNSTFIPSASAVPTNEISAPFSAVDIASAMPPSGDRPGNGALVIPFILD